MTHHNSKTLAALAACALVWGGACGASGPARAPSDLFDSTRQAPAWSAWSPVVAGASPLLPQLPDTTAFDHWALDPSEVEALWQGVYPTLDALRLNEQVSQPVRTSVQALAALLDPAQGVTLYADVTFLANATELWEGVLVQLYAPRPVGAPVHLAVLIQRPERAGAPGAVTLWGRRAFEESSAWSARLEPAQAGAATLRVAAPLVRAPARVVETSEGVELMRSLMIAGVWPKVTKAAYLEPTIKHSKARAARVPGVPMAAGFALKERSIEEVLSRTVFVPDMGDAGFEGGL